MTVTWRGLGIAAAMVLLASPGGAAVKLRAREIQAPPSPAAARDDVRTWIVAASTQIRGDLTSSIRRAGGRIVAYLPDNALLVRADLAVVSGWLGDDSRSLAGVSFVTPYLLGDKLAPELAAAMDGRLGGPLPVHVLIAPDVSAATVAADLVPSGVTVTGTADSGAFHDLGLLLPPGRLDLAELVAAHPDVLWIEPRARRVLLNDTSIWVGQSGLDGTMATPVFENGILGVGETVAVLDTGLDYDMCYFRDTAGAPVINRGTATAFDATRRKVVAYDMLYGPDDPANQGDYDDQDHGTHVAGTVCGDNDANPLTHDPGDGMAPGAKLVVQDGGYAVDDCADLPALGCPVVDLTPIFDQSYQQGARIHSNSWGDRENFSPQNTYTAACVDVDDFMYTHPDFLIVFAAGNGGPGNDTVGSPSTAKNTISVGATQRASAAESIAGFSSRGNTADGRIRPTVTAPGQGIVSAANDGNINTMNCATQGSSGTSMACPGVAGLAALVGEYYTAGYYPSGARNPGDGFTPSAALRKATLVNSGREMTGETAIPSRAAGWGRVTLGDTLAFRGGDRDLFVVDERTGFAPGATTPDTYTVDVRGSLFALKATLVWTDPPSSPMAAVNLENDLDLIVSGPSGTYLGNVFAAGVSVAGGLADRLNVEEQVLLPAPVPGIYTVTIAPSNIPLNPQPYALVVSGDLPTPLYVTMEGSAVVQDENVNGWPDPGEIVRLAITLGNRSDELATAVSAQLVALDANATVTDGAASWPDIAPDAQATSLPDHFELRVATDVACGSVVPLRLLISAGGKNFAADFSMPLGGLGLAWSERFDATSEGAIPAGWTLTSSRPAWGTARADASVEPATSSGPTSPPHALFMGTDASDTVTTRTEMATPLNLAAYAGSQVVLSFRWWAYDADANERLVAAISDRGSTIYDWELLRTPSPFDSAVDGGGLWGQVSVDLSTLAGFDMAGDVWLRFDTRLSRNEADGDAFYVDDIEVRAPTCDVVTRCVELQPDASATDTSPVCPNTAVTLDGSRSTSTIGCTDFSYRWYDGALPVGSGVTATVYPLDTTSYRLELTCNAPPSCTATSTVSIPILPASASSVDFNSLRALRSGGSASFQWTGSGGDFNFGSTLFKSEVATMYALSPLNVSPLTVATYSDAPPPAPLVFYQAFGINSCNGRSVP